jgi:hypothetical protein
MCVLYCVLYLYFWGPIRLSRGSVWHASAGARRPNNDSARAAAGSLDRGERITAAILEVGKNLA